MLSVNGVGSSSSSEKFPSETVKIYDSQTLCFWLIKGPTRLINKPNKISTPKRSCRLPFRIPGLLASAVHIIKAHNIVLAKIFTTLHLNHYQVS